MTGNIKLLCRAQQEEREYYIMANVSRKNVFGFFYDKNSKIVFLWEGLICRYLKKQQFEASQAMGTFTDSPAVLMRLYCGFIRTLLSEKLDRSQVNGSQVIQSSIHPSIYVLDRVRAGEPKLPSPQLTRPAFPGSIPRRSRANWET